MATSCIEDIKTDLPDEKYPEPTWKELHRANRNVAVPFRFSLTDHDIPLICEEIIRIIPKKRLVAFGVWGELSVVAKIFYESGQAQRHLTREVAGIEQLINAKIPTSKLLWQGTAQKQKIHILIFERITGGANLNDLWLAKRDPEEMLPLMRAVTIELATQHVLGIVQHDLHLKNFLVTPKQIFTLDAGALSTFDTILPKEESLDHLALFFAQLGVGTEQLQATLFQIYANARGWLIRKTDIKKLQQMIAKWNEKRWERYKKKIHRNSTSFVRKNSFNSLAIYDQTYYSNDFEKFLQNPDFVFHNTQLLKAGNSSTVAKVQMDGRFFVVKRYNIKNFWHWVRRCLRTTRAAKSWELSHQLFLFGIPTAKPVGYLQKQFFGFKSTSYFIMEWVEGPHIGEYFADYDVSDPLFEKVAQRVLALFNNLKRLSCTHGDLKQTNILINQDYPILIDLDGMVEHSSKFNLKRAYRAEIKRFMRNWENRPSVKALFAKCFGL